MILTGTQTEPLIRKIGDAVAEKINLENGYIPYSMIMNEMDGIYWLRHRVAFHVENLPIGAISSAIKVNKATILGHGFLMEYHFKAFDDHRNVFDGPMIDTGLHTYVIPSQITVLDGDVHGMEMDDADYLLWWLSIC